MRRVRFYGLFLGICLFVFCFGITHFLKVSYAADDIFPTDYFTTNMSTSSTVNYVQDAMQAGSISVPDTISNFTAPKSLTSSTNSVPLYELMLNANTPTNNAKFQVINSDTPVNINDVGLIYIMTHGYNKTNQSNTVFSNGSHGNINNEKKQYVTQIAIWLYIYEKNTTSHTFDTNYCKNNGCTFYHYSGGEHTSAASVDEIKSAISSAAGVTDYKYLTYITDLVNAAKSYTSSSTYSITTVSGDSLQYHMSDTTITTNAINPTASDNAANFTYYTVTIVDPNHYGVYLVDTDNNKIENTNTMPNSFKVVIPFADDISTMDLTSIKIQIKGHFIKDEGRDYRVTSKMDGTALTKNDNFSNVLFGYAPDHVVTNEFSFKNFVIVTKVDSTDSSALEGATLVIKKKGEDTEAVPSWTSTKKPHYVFLDDGDYVLCETAAPTGYDLQTECVEFTVVSTKVTSVKMENKPSEVDIPNTSKFRSKILLCLGILFIVVGATISGIILMKKNKA